jgi:PEP-CTERM motif
MKSTVLAVLVCAFAGIAPAAQILETGFGAGKIVDDYVGLGGLFPLSCGGTPCQTTPMTINGNTYRTSAADGFFLRYLTTQPCDGDSSCLNTNSDLGFVDVTFPVPYLRAGIWAGNFEGATILYEFFAPNNSLVGSVVSSAFVGWEDVGGIERIRVTDQSVNSTSMLVDHLIVEGPLATAAPEPGTVMMLLAGAGLLAVRRRIFAAAGQSWPAS